MPTYSGALQEVANVFTAANTFLLGQNYAIDTGSVNAYVSATPLTSLNAGVAAAFLIGNTNTGASTLAVASTGAIAIRKFNAAALVAGDLPAGRVAEVVYDGTYWILQNPSAVAASGANSDITSLTAVTSVGSSGALGLSAGGSNQNITLTPSGTGQIGIGSSDVLLARDAANTLALRNGTNAQMFRVYNTFDGTNGEFLGIGFQSNFATIFTGKVGTGSERNLALGWGTGGARWYINLANAFYPSSNNAYDLGITTNYLRTGYFGTSIQTPIIKPGADSATAVQITKADGSTSVLNVDTTNARVGIGTASPTQLLTLKSTGSMAWDNGSGTADTGLSRTAAATVAVGNGTAGDASGTLKAANVGTSGTPITNIYATTISSATTGDGSRSIGFRNRIINGDIRIDQRNAGASQAITAAAALAYTVDRFYAYCTGANVTGQQVAGSTSTQYRYMFTGASSVTAIGFGTRLETTNTYDLNNSTATLAVDLANSLLTTVTWTAYYANSTDAFGTLASPTRTQIATGTFTVTSTIARYSTQISIPSAATTGIEVVLSVGAQTSGTWTIGNVQLEAGSVATPFERVDYSSMLTRCQRYFYSLSSLNPVGVAYIGTNVSTVAIPIPVPMRATPTVTGSGSWRIRYGAADYTASNYAVYGISGNIVSLGVTSIGTSNGNAGVFWGESGAISLSAEL